MPGFMLNVKKKLNNNKTSDGSIYEFMIFVIVFFYY